MTFIFLTVFLELFSMGTMSVTSEYYCEDSSQTDTMPDILTLLHSLIIFDIRRCCTNYKMVNGKCELCPIGTFGINCTDPCPAGYYGVLCYSKCECSDDQICNQMIGCTFPDNYSIDGNALAGSLIPISTIILIMIFAVVIIGIRYRTSSVSANSRNNAGNERGLSYINAFSNPNNLEYPYYSYSKGNMYEGIEKETADQYDEIELRIPNDFLARSLMNTSEKSKYFTVEREATKKNAQDIVGSREDELETKSEYFTLEREVKQVKNQDVESNLENDEHNEYKYETPLTMYDLASNTK